MKQTTFASLAVLLLAAAACGDDSDGSGGAGGTASTTSASSTGGPSSTSTGTSSSRASSAVSGSGGSPDGSGGTGGAPDGSGGTGGAPDGSGGTGGAPAGSGGAGGGSGVEIENVSQTPGTLSHDGTVAWIDGTLVAAWSEPDSDVLSDQDIASRTREDGDWSAVEFLTEDVERQNAFPSMATDGTVADLFWNGPPDGTQDIFLAHWEGGAWGARQNLTASFEDEELRGDYDPAAVMLSSGEAVAAYLSAEVDDGGAFLGPSEVRVIGADGEAPVTVIAMEDDSDCNEVAVVEAEGRLRVVAACGFGGASLWYAERSAEGVWSEQEELLETDSGTIALAASPGGFDVAWLQYGGCDSGEFCIAWARVDDDGVAAQVEIESNAAMYSPAIAVDADGSPIVAYHEFNDDNWGDVFLVRGVPAGGGFGAPLNLTPGTPDSDEWRPSSIHIGEGGEVSVLFEGTLADSNPLDAEIFLATVAP